MTISWLTERPFAHRGLHGPATGHVENSLSAFRAAEARGHGAELDVLLSRDGRAMVFHDLTLERLTAAQGRLDAHSAAALGRIQLRHSEDVIPTLAGVLAAIQRATPLLIEIKGDQNKPHQIAAAVCEDVRACPGSRAIMSFYPDILRWFQIHAPEIPRGLVATSIPEESLPATYFTPDHQIALIEELAVDFIAYDIQALPNPVTEYCQMRQIPVLTWTVRSPEAHRKAAKHADNIIYEKVT